LVEPIREKTTPGAEQENRRELKGGSDAEGEAASGQVQDQPHLGN